MKAARISVRQHANLRLLIAAVGASVVVGIVLALPTAIIANPLFSRMTPVEPEQYGFWIATSVLTGTLLATYVRPGATHGLAGTGAGAGLLGLFAIGCPICNKLIVAAIGSSGALSIFAPIQPLLGVAAVLVSGYALLLRLRTAEREACTIPAMPHLSRRG